MTLVLVLLSVLVHQVARNLTDSTAFLSRWVLTPTTSPWFSTLKEQRFFARMAHFAPALFFLFGANLFPAPIPTEIDPFPHVSTFETWHDWLVRFGLAYGGFVCMIVAQAFVNACDEIYTDGQPEDSPIEGIIRAAKRFVLLVGLVLICAALAKRSPVVFVGSLGAFMAVIMLVFKDAILGLAASVQIIGQKMMKIGDWIEMPKYGVDGFVSSMSLTTIKVQNFDKTIASLPTYSALSDSFKNWRGMQEAGGRRIKRAVFIDMNTIKPCGAEMCDHFENIDLIRDYIRRKRQELRDHLLQSNVTMSPVNARWLTNIGTFRVYVEEYLKRHPKVSNDLMCLARQLPPSADGLPLEIYCFCTETGLVDYEQVQADIFDHILSVLPEFELRVFQNPRAYDYEQVDELYSHRIDRRVIAAANGSVAARKLQALEELVAEKNKALASRPRTRISTAVRTIRDEIESEGLGDHVRVVSNGRKIVLEMD